MCTHDSLVNNNNTKQTRLIARRRLFYAFISVYHSQNFVIHLKLCFIIRNICFRSPLFYEVWKVILDYIINHHILLIKYLQITDR